MERSTRVIFFIGGFALLLFGACSTQDLAGSEPTATYDDVVKTRVAQRNDVPTRTPIPTSTPFFRPNPTIVSTAGPTSTPLPTLTPEPTPTTNPMSAELAPVLLGTEDLPTGWRMSGEGVDLELTDSDNVCGVPIQDPAVAELVGTYEGSLNGPYASQYLSLYDGPGDATAVFEQMQTAFNECPPEGFDYGDGSWGYISPISFPQVGEQSMGMRLGVGIEDFVYEFDMIVFRVDELVVTLVYEDTAAIFGGASDPAMLEDLVRRAEARVHAQAPLIDSINVSPQTI